MDKFDIRSAKLVLIICLILFTFVLVVANAYKYLPEESSNMPSINSEIVLPTDNEENTNNTEPQDAEISQEEAPVQKKINQAKPIEDILPSQNEVPPLENFSETDSINMEQNLTTVQETYDSVFESAEKLKNNTQLVKAIEDYKKALTLAESNKQKAMCYEAISNIYAITKKYGTALSYAQKAYNLAPSSSREMLLARLYYKTGDIDKATERVNNILRRDFAQDNN